MPYHVEITTKSQPLYPEYALDLTKAKLQQRFVQPYDQGLPITTSGKTIAPDDIMRMRIILTRQPSSILLTRIRAQRKADPVKVAIPDEFYLRNYGKEVTDDLVTGSPGTRAPSSADTTLATTVDPRKVFVIHGRDKQASNSLFAFLRSIDLHPLEWSEAVKATGKPNPYIADILNKAFSIAQAAVVLMTGDDKACLRQCFWRDGDPDYEKEPTRQARPNVLFEAGMAMGRFRDRTVLVELGTLRPFTDIAGLHVVRLNNSVRRRQELAHRLQSCGCKVNLDGTQWHTAGTFAPH